jgi:hypothetical protein
MFLTEREPKKAATQASQVMAMRQAAQQLRVVEDWEPRVVGALAGLPGLCLAALLKIAEAQAAQPAEEADRARYDSALEVVHRYAMSVPVPRAQALLEEMVRAEARSLVENITFHGLLGKMPDTSDWPRRLAGATALKESHQRSWAEFRARVAAELDAAEDLDPAQLTRSLARHAQWWTGRLKAIAVTLTHAAINRARKEAGAAV